MTDGNLVATSGGLDPLQPRTAVLPNASVWLTRVRYFDGWIYDTGHAPDIVVLGKAWSVVAYNPMMNYPLLLGAGVWVIRAFNITFDTAFRTVVDSAAAPIGYVLIVVADFGEGNITARILTVVRLICRFAFCFGRCVLFMGDVLRALLFRLISNILSRFVSPASVGKITTSADASDKD